MLPKRIGFIGFGEAASTFAKALCDHGASIAAFDILINTEDGLKALKRRCDGVDVSFLQLEEVIKESELIISTVTTDVALAAAQNCAGLLSSSQIYFDLNSTSPGIKIEISETIKKVGAGFLEGVVLGAIGATGAATKVLLGGDLGEEYAIKLKELGLNTSFFSKEIGKASTFKMIRSVFSKGAEALLLEMLLAGKKAGLEEELWKDIVGFMEAKPFGKIASNWIQTHAVACERRYFEMLQVCGTMEELSVEPTMATATAEVFKHSVEVGLKDMFKDKASSVSEVIEVLSQHVG